MKSSILPGKGTLSIAAPHADRSVTQASVADSHWLRRGVGFRCCRNDHRQPPSARQRLGVCATLRQRNGWPQPPSRNAGIWCGSASLALSETVQQGRCNRKTCALTKLLFVLELFQRHCAKRISVTHAALRKLNDLPSNETRCGIVYHLQAQRIADALKRLRHFVDGLRIKRLAGQKRIDRHNSPLQRTSRSEGAAGHSHPR